MKKFLKSRMAKFCLVEIILAVIAISAYLYYQEYQRNNQHDYEPFAISANGLTLNTVESAPMMEGTPEGDLMLAHPDGSKIFAKGGLNYVVANSGADEFYYSMCSTKIIDGKVNVIEGFDPKHDKLKIFCVSHGKYKDIEITYVDIKGQHTDTAVILLGNIDIKPHEVILNERWVAMPVAPGM